MILLSIDPGTDMSAYSLMTNEYRLVDAGLVSNETMLTYTKQPNTCDHLAIEGIASYGMPVGKEVFDTCILIGRLWQIGEYNNVPTTLVYRKDVKMNLCGTMKAKDGNIRQALIDRFGVVGTKKNPGFFYGFKADMWSSFAIGTTWFDMQKGLYK